MNFFIISLVLAIITGQIVKIPLNYLNGITILDLTVIFLNIILLFKVVLKSNFLNSLKLLLRNKLVVLPVIFTFVAILSLVFSPLKLEFSESLISSLYILRLFSYMLFSWLLLLEEFSNLRSKIFQILTTAGILLSFLGITQLIFIPNIQFLETDGWDPHLFRIVSTFLDPNFLGAYFVLTLILLTKNTKFSKYFFVIVFISLLFTFSRSSIVMLFVSFLTISIIKKSVKMFILTFILTLILYGSYSFYNLSFEASHKIDRQKSAESRLFTWEVGQKVFEKSPILGVGFNSYRFALREYNLAYNNSFFSRSASGNDSSLLFILATTGIVGFSVFLVYILVFIYKALLTFKHNPLAILFLAGVAGLLFHSFFNNSLFYPPLLFWWLLMGIA